jgi:two-component sensor histidine kinase
VHRLFGEQHWLGAKLNRLVTEELAPYCKGLETTVRIEGPDMLLEPDTAQTLSVALHELATNAAKYGALSVSEGRVHVQWSCSANDRLVLRWAEMGGPLVKPPTHEGFGTRVMKGMIEGHLKGRLRFDWREGLSCEITVPNVR